MAHHEVLVVGGGDAGIALAARLLRDGARDVAVVESESVHRYRPLPGPGASTLGATRTGRAAALAALRLLQEHAAAA